MDIQMTKGLCFYLDAIYDMRQSLKRTIPVVNKRRVASTIFWEHDYRKPVLRDLTHIFQQNKISNGRSALTIEHVSIFPFQEA